MEINFIILKTKQNVIVLFVVRYVCLKRYKINANIITYTQNAASTTITVKFLRQWQKIGAKK